MDPANLLRRVVRKSWEAIKTGGPSVRVCLVPYCDLFPKPNNQLYISLLAQDAIKRAGIDMTKPFVLEYDRQRAYYRFVQHEDDCK